MIHRTPEVRNGETSKSYNVDAKGQTINVGDIVIGDDNEVMRVVAVHDGALLGRELPEEPGNQQPVQPTYCHQCIVCQRAAGDEGNGELAGTAASTDRLVRFHDEVYTMMSQVDEALAELAGTTAGDGVEEERISKSFDAALERLWSYLQHTPRRQQASSPAADSGPFPHAMLLELAKRYVRENFSEAEIEGKDALQIQLMGSNGGAYRTLLNFRSALGLDAEEPDAEAAA